MSFRGKQKIAFGKITLSAPPAFAPAAAESTEDGEPKDPSDKPPSDSGGGFGSFTFKPPEKKKEPELSPEELEIQNMMGFTGFGTSKKVVEKSAKNFDVKEMVEAIRKAKKLQKKGLKSDDDESDEDVQEETSTKAAKVEATASSVSSESLDSKRANVINVLIGVFKVWILITYFNSGIGRL